MRHSCQLLNLILIICGFLGCQQPSGETVKKSIVHPSSANKSAEKILLKASGACLAKIKQLEELNEMPSDGDHFVRAWLEPIEQTGLVPEFLYLVIQYGGMRPVEDLQELDKRELILRHDSLKVGEKHWFVFSEQYDASKYPPQVAAWWRYETGEVPRDLTEAIKNDRLKVETPDSENLE